VTTQKSTNRSDAVGERRAEGGEPDHVDGEVRDAAVQQRVAYRAGEGIDVYRKFARIADRNKGCLNDQPEILLLIEHVEPDEVDADARDDEGDHHARQVEHRLPAAGLLLGVWPGMWLAAWLGLPWLGLGDRLGHAL
jgi:hypothetical protein